MSFMTMFCSNTFIYNTKTFAPSSHDYLKMTKKINIYYQNSLTVAKHVIYLYIHPIIRAKTSTKENDKTMNQLYSLPYL